MRVLLIEDDSATAQGIELMLKSAGMNIYSTDLGEEGIDLLKLYDYDVCVMDDTLPDMHLYDVLKQARAARVQTPILVLAGKHDIDHKIRALSYADDVMTKPFNNDELIARIGALVRRSKGHSMSTYAFGTGFTINYDAKIVEYEGQRIHLTGKEYQMLELLTLRHGQTITKEMFLNHLYGGMDEPELKIIDVFVTKLRKKLAAASGGEHCIETVWGRGYVLRGPQDPPVVGDTPPPAPAQTEQPPAQASSTDGPWGPRDSAPTKKPGFMGGIRRLLDRNKG